MKYLLNEKEIEALAAERASSGVLLENVDSTYLRALVACVQRELKGRHGRLGSEPQLTALETIAAPFYAAVLRGVTTPDIVLTADMEPDEVTRRSRERNRRGTFARTAKSTLASWVKVGGDLRKLKPDRVTKHELRKEIVKHTADAGATIAARFDRAQKAMLSAIADESPAEARVYLEQTITMLQSALADLSPNASVVLETPTFRGHVTKGRHQVQPRA